MRAATILVLAWGACAAPVDEPERAWSGPEAVLQPGGDFWAAPVPGPLRQAGTLPDVRAFPNPDGIGLVQTLVTRLGRVAQGWGVSSAVVVPFDRAVSVDPPDLEATLDPGSGVWLVDLETVEAVPVHVGVRDGDGPFDPAHAVVLLPVQGIPLRAGARYAAVLTRDLPGLRDAQQAPALAAWAAGEPPQGWTRVQAEALLDARPVVEAAGVPLDDVVGLTAFTTDDPLREVETVAEHLRGEGLGLTLAPVFVEEHDTFCVLQGEVTVPVYQAGDAPYSTSGGQLVIGGTGPEVQGTETARLFVTLPATPPTAEPGVVVFIRTGGGGDRPLIDRGIRTEGGVDVTGTGYAVEVAAAGLVGVQLDGALGGLRNPTGGDEQFLLFHVANPEAMAGNLGQSAAELTALPALLDALVLDPSGCTGWSEVDALTLDTDRIALFGHSMGATIGPVAAALQPRFEALVLSGAGGSWIHNVVSKERPLRTRPLAAAILHDDEDSLTRFHPALSLLQWAGEGADPPIVGDRLRDRDVLMVQGLVDHYILPDIANATSLALHLDQAGPALDGEAVPAMLPLDALRPLVGTAATELPVTLNQGDRTRVVVQVAEDGVEDGHEVAFQVPEARAQVGCFLETWARDEPVVVAPGAPCP